MLHQRHADAADHAADALAARRLGVHDPTGSVRSHDAPHTRLTEIGIDGDFHAHGAKGMHRESLAFVAPLHVCRGLAWLTDSAHRCSNIVAATPSKRALARLRAGRSRGAA